MINKPELMKAVFNFIIDGHSNSDIFDFLSENGADAEDSKLIFEDALRKFMKSTQMPVEVRMGWCLEAYSRLYQKFMASGDYPGALRAVQEIAKLTEIKGEFKKEKSESVEDYIDDQLSVNWELKTHEDLELINGR